MAVQTVDVNNDMIDQCLKSKYLVKQNDGSQGGVMVPPFGRHFVDCKRITSSNFGNEFRIAQKAYNKYEDAKGMYLGKNPKVQVEYLSPDPNEQPKSVSDARCIK